MNDFLPIDQDFPEPHMEKQRGWADMTHDQRARMRTNMFYHGGNFASAIGRAFIYADPANAHKLATAFPELVQKYGIDWGRK